MTGLVFVIFTFYMITDPGTTPSRPWMQVAFGGSVAATYGLLVAAHIVFGLIFALAVVCTARGLAMYAQAFIAAPVRRALTVRAARPILVRTTQL
jgi:hypothetical protein